MCNGGGKKEKKNIKESFIINRLRSSIIEKIIIYLIHVMLNEDIFHLIQLYQMIFN